jgi:hypothetical protein
MPAKVCGWFNSVAVAGGIALLGSAAYDDTVSMTFDEVGLGQGVIFKFDGNGDGAFSGGAGSGDLIGATVAGRLSWSVQSVTGDANPYSAGQTLYTFCTEVNQYVGLGQTYTYDLISAAQAPLSNPMGETAANALGSLFGAYYETAVNGTNAQAAAFQIAVWEIVYEMADAVEGLEDLNVNTGEFRVIAGATARAQANSWLASLAGLLVDGQILGFGNLSGQDQLALGALAGGGVVPLPAPVMLAGFGLLGLVLARRRLRLTLR